MEKRKRRMWLTGRQWLAVVISLVLVIVAILSGGVALLLRSQRQAAALEATLTAIRRAAANPTLASPAIVMPEKLIVTQPPFTSAAPTRTFTPLPPTAVPPSATPTSTPAPTLPSVTGLIIADDTFENGINGDHWIYFPDDWIYAGNRLLTARTTCLISKRQDLSRYTLEVWLISEGNSFNYAIQLNQTGGVGGVQALIGFANDEAGGYLQDRGRTLPASHFTLPLLPASLADGLYLRADVDANRFQVYVESTRVIDIQPLSAPTAGSAGICINTLQIQLVRARLVERL